MNHRIIQANINNWDAKNLLEHQVKELEFAIAIVAEPPNVKDAQNWWVSEGGKAAILWNAKLIKSCKLLDIDKDFVIIELAGIAIAFFYFSPNGSSADFESTLDILERAIKKIRMKGVILAGDFNARSTSWRDKLTNNKGLILERWAETNELNLINYGNTPTFHHAFHGESIIDLT